MATVASEATSLDQAAKGLTGYGIDVRYPGERPDGSAAKQALADCVVVRSLLRRLLGFPV